MKTLLLALAIVFSFQLTGVYAQTKEVPAQTSATQQTIKPITVKVNGLVCSFCAQGIKKRFLALDAVQSVQVSLGKKTVVLVLKPQAVLPDKTIEDTVKDAGYNTVRIER